MNFVITFYLCHAACIRILQWLIHADYTDSYCYIPLRFSFSAGATVQGTPLFQEKNLSHTYRRRITVYGPLLTLIRLSSRLVD